MTPTIYHHQCLCCGSAAISKSLECKDYTVSGEVFEIWQCGNCTFRFTQDAPAAEYIQRYYQSANYVSHSDIKKGLINRLYHFVRKFTLRSKTSLVKKVTGLQQGSLLDVGAGTGAFANAMHAVKWNVTALEPDETARTNAFSNYNLQLQPLSNLEYLQAETFDAITLWHVLEHVHDLHNYLERFYQLLKTSGRLIIAVPNYCSYDAQVYGEHWAAYDVPRHLYHFSPKSMRTFLEQKGFVTAALKPMRFDSFYVSMLSEKYKSKRENLLTALATGLVSNIKALSNTEKCSSVIYVLSKR